MVLPLFAGLLVSKPTPDLERRRDRLRPDRLVPLRTAFGVSAGRPVGRPGAFLASREGEVS